MTIPKIKICGITQAEEIQMLNRAGVDYAGFVFYGPSKRNIDIETAKALAKDLNPKIKKTAVTVSPSAEDINRIEEAGFADVSYFNKTFKRIVGITPLQYRMREFEIEEESEMPLSEE